MTKLCHNPAPAVLCLKPLQAGRFAMRIRRLAVALAAGLTALAFTAARADVLIRVDKAAQLMTVTVDGAQRYAWKVSTGLSLIHISEPTRLLSISYAVFC